MKQYSIGRESGCDITINDNTDVISRRHAILSVSSLGRMTITDQSTNGTYVNGMRIKSNEAYPVTRKDNVIFAQISRLDWNRIPDPLAIYKYIVGAVLGIVIFALLAWGGIKRFGGHKTTPNKTPIENTSGQKEQQQKEEEKEKEEKEEKEKEEKEKNEKKEKEEKEKKEKEEKEKKEKEEKEKNKKTSEKKADAKENKDNKEQEQPKTNRPRIR